MSLKTREFLVLLLSLFLALSEQKIVRDDENGLIYAGFVRNRNRKLFIGKLEAHKVRDESDCGAKCLSHSKCVSMDYFKNVDNQGKHWCDLLSANKFTSELRANSEADHFSIATKCDEVPCLNGGTCVPLYEKNSYKCQCPFWFNGTNTTHCDKETVAGRIRPGTSLGQSWTAFWWFDANATWPSNETDVLAYEFGQCRPQDPYCFGRIPSQANEHTTELLAIDSEGTEYKWRFSSGNPTAHAAWRAFHDHEKVTYEEAKHQSAEWNPIAVKGSSMAGQDSFMYREEAGVKSVLLDDDGCDCHSSLNIGHGMCFEGHLNGTEGQFGVDVLYDPECGSPRPGIGLTLYFRTQVPN